MRLFAEVCLCHFSARELPSGEAGGRVTAPVADVVRGKVVAAEEGGGVLRYIEGVVTGGGTARRHKLTTDHSREDNAEKFS
ncbi:hypothetical protein Hamer_G007322 [Homarus americanus]|uniref:Uncharacterized protein n=1 Tax=Homarus americanus TaxID=6706 RepID=A0A8J5JZL0_HOMAM|nr:hypothetical protein Hamer_G007322 [Homarus americanus]